MAWSSCVRTTPSRSFTRVWESSWPLLGGLMVLSSKFCLSFEKVLHFTEGGFHKLPTSLYFVHLIPSSCTRNKSCHISFAQDNSLLKQVQPPPLLRRPSTYFPSPPHWQCQLYQ